MRIVFICGSLAAGKDGVGDYTRRLAAELLRQGHAVRLVALHDWHIHSLVEEDQVQNEVELRVCRIPSAFTNTKKAKSLKQYVQSFQPELVSLQFVPYSYSSRGFPVGLAKLLRQAVGATKWHIMLHEVWLVSRHFNLKRKLTAAVQKAIVRQLVTQLQPIVVHTQSQYSQFLLAKQAIKAKLLPLFSNIPVHTKRADSQTYLDHTKKEISILTFGSIHPNAQIEKFAGEVAEYQRKHQVKVNLDSCGQIRSRSSKMATGLETKRAYCQDLRRNEWSANFCCTFCGRLWHFIYAFHHVRKEWGSSRNAGSST